MVSGSIKPKERTNIFEKKDLWWDIRMEKYNGTTKLFIEDARREEKFI